MSTALPVDRLDGLLQRFAVSAEMFHSGPLCGIHDFDDSSHGQLHLLRRGPLEVHQGGTVQRVSEPSLLFYPRPMHHRFVSDPDSGADLACANLSFGSSPTQAAATSNPIRNALPDFLCLPLAQLPGANALLELLFDEAFAQRCGRQALVNRLFDAVLILLLRHLLDSGHIHQGPLAGLGHPQLAKALVAMHDQPAQAWTIDTLAHRAGMSRSRFAEVFAQLVGQPPAAYLANYRITLAQNALARGERLDRIAQQTGYGSATALSRAFTSICGISPRQWKQRVEMRSLTAVGHLAQRAT